LQTALDDEEFNIGGDDNSANPTTVEAVIETEVTSLQSTAVATIVTTPVEEMTGVALAATTSIVSTSDGTVDKLSARAARFGIPNAINSSNSLTEETIKKKLRAERFGLLPSTTTAPAAASLLHNPVLDQKLVARAARFGLPLNNATAAAVVTVDNAAKHAQGQQKSGNNKRKQAPGAVAETEEQRVAREEFEEKKRMRQERFGESLASVAKTAPPVAAAVVTTAVVDPALQAKLKARLDRFAYAK